MTRKLTNTKVKGIISRKTLGFSNKEIAERYNISVRRVKQLFKAARENNNVPPKLKRPGKTLKKPTVKEKTLVLQSYKRHKTCACYLEKLINLPHNKIHVILKEAGISLVEPNKGKRRKWVRYEREHAFSLVHLDWHETEDKKYIIFVEDDATRAIIAFGEFESANLENTVFIMKKAINFAKSYNSKIRQALTDNGSVFTTIRRDEDTSVNLLNQGFEELLKKEKIEHVYTAVHHPQTNGKLERLFGTFERKKKEFKSLKAFVEWYNTLKPHISLDYDFPMEALKYKLREEELIGLVWEKMFEENIPIKEEVI